MVNLQELRKLSQTDLARLQHEFAMAESKARAAGDFETAADAQLAREAVARVYLDVGSRADLSVVDRGLIALMKFGEATGQAFSESLRGAGKAIGGALLPVSPFLALAGVVALLLLRPR